MVPTQTFSLIGQTIRWKFDDGPTPGAVYEHTFHPDGTVSYHQVQEGKTPKPTVEKRYAAFEVAPEVHLVSYLGASGYTLTVAMNLVTARVFGVASNGEDWVPLTGSLEIVE
jgi:hypothetical protein